MKRLLLVAALALSSAITYGQNALATVTGTVTDSTGAVLADAAILVKNIENGSEFRTVTSSTGNYTVSQLPIGDYDMNITAAGFKTYNHAKFHLASAQTMREDVQLEVGQTSESVTVTAEASLLKTETTELAQNVTLKQLNNLPILPVGASNSGFRDPFNSVRLVPGVQYISGSNVASGAPAAVTTMVINGTPANTYQTRLDGMTMNPTGPRLLGAQQETQPSVDAIEEVAVMTSNFAAEYGAAGGAMITMTTKSGTNQYHGSAYDYGTNEALNAHQPYTGLRNKIRQNDFGFTLGGPVKIPKLYDGTNKTFFFSSLEMFKQTNIVNDSSSVPTAAYRGGDFSNLITAESRLITRASGGTSVPVYDPFGNPIPSGTIFNPFSQRPITCNTAPVNGNVPTCTNGSTYQYRDAFVGNQIPATYFDPAALKVLALVPNPKGVNFDKGLVTNNWTSTYDTSRTSSIPSIKIDQNIGSKGRLSIYYQRTETFSPRTPTGADSLPNTITAGVSTYNTGKTGRVSYDYTITPKFLLHLGAGWNDTDFKLTPPVTNFDTYKELGIPGQVESKYFPVIVTGASTNNQIGGMDLLGNVYATKSFERRPSGTVSASYVAGSHTFKFGADGRIEKFPNYVSSGVNANTSGNYTFGSNYTQQPFLLGTTTNQGFNGFQFASFMLGGVSSAALVAPTALSNSKSQWGLYAQDTWKITRKLTFDYGLRWDLGTYAREQYGRNGSVGLAIPNPSASGRLGATQFENTCNCNFASNYMKGWGPRVGVAYQINPKTVFRAGFGIVYNATATASGSSTQSATSGSVPAGSGQIVSLFKDGLPAAGVHAVWPSTDPGVGQPVGTVVAMPALLDQNAGRPARLAQWSIGLQREFTRNTVVEGSYVGNRGVWWTAAGLAPLNALSQQTLNNYGFNNFTSSTEAALLTTTVANLTAAQQSTLLARGITGLPYANFPNTQTVRQSLLAYPQYNTNGLSGAPLGKTWYDAFQLNVTQRFSHGLSFNMNYTWSKNLSLMSSPDVFNRRLGKTYSGNDVPHQFRLTVQYVVPSMKNNGWGFLSNKYVAYAFADWGIGAYMSYQSALVLGRPSSTSTTPISQFLGRGPGSAQLKTDAFGQYMNPFSVDWYDYSGKHHTDPLDINCHCFDPTKTTVFNTNAWTNIPDGQWGAQQDTFRYMRGIRVPQENANFSRNFRFGKEGRFNFNARIEFNNIFNRMILPNPSTAGNFATAPTKITDPTNPNVGLYSGGYGTFNVLSGIGNQRTGTFVGRFTF
jgi:hypothetical protein